MSNIDPDSDSILCKILIGTTVILTGAGVTILIKQQDFEKITVDEK